MKNDTKSNVRHSKMMGEVTSCISFFLFMLLAALLLLWVIPNPTRIDSDKNNVFNLVPTLINRSLYKLRPSLNDISMNHWSTISSNGSIISYTPDMLTHSSHVSRLALLYVLADKPDCARVVVDALKRTESLKPQIPSFIADIRAHGDIFEVSNATVVTKHIPDAGYGSAYNLLLSVSEGFEYVIVVGADYGFEVNAEIAHELVDKLEEIGGDIVAPAMCPSKSKNRDCISASGSIVHHPDIGFELLPNIDRNSNDNVVAGCYRTELFPEIFVARRDSLARVQWDIKMKKFHHLDLELALKANGIHVWTCPEIRVTSDVVGCSSLRGPAWGRQFVGTIMRNWDMTRLVDGINGIEYLLRDGSMLISTGEEKHHDNDIENAKKTAVNLYNDGVSANLYISAETVDVLYSRRLSSCQNKAVVHMKVKRQGSRAIYDIRMSFTDLSRIDSCVYLDQFLSPASGYWSEIESYSSLDAVYAIIPVVTVFKHSSNLQLMYRLLDIIEMGKTKHEATLIVVIVDFRAQDSSRKYIIPPGLQSIYVNASTAANLKFGIRMGIEAAATESLNFNGYGNPRMVILNPFVLPPLNMVTLIQKYTICNISIFSPLAEPVGFGSNEDHFSYYSLLSFCYKDFKAINSFAVSDLNRHGLLVIRPRKPSLFSMREKKEHTRLLWPKDSRLIVSLADPLPYSSPGFVAIKRWLSSHSLMERKGKYEKSNSCVDLLSVLMFRRITSDSPSPRQNNPFHKVSIRESIRTMKDPQKNSITIFWCICLDKDKRMLVTVLQSSLVSRIHHFLMQKIRS